MDIRIMPPSIIGEQDSVQYETNPDGGEVEVTKPETPSETTGSPIISEEIIKSLDDKTDQIFTLRSGLASIYPTIKEYLPIGKKGRRLYLDGVLKRVDDGESLDSIINYGRLNEKDIENTPVGQVAKQVQKDTITATMQIALNKQRELRELGGDFIGQGPVTSDDPEVRNYYRHRVGKFGESKRKIEGLEDKIAILDEQEALISKPNAGNQEINTAVIRMYQEQRDRALREIREETKTPEGYLYVYGKRLKDMKDCLDGQGRIVETPYVKSKMKTIENSLKNGGPVFIHGELGSGKTELAKHIARKMMLERWENENPKPKDEKERSRWEIERIRQKQILEPVLISGHKSVEPETITGARTIQRVQVPSPEEQLNIINQKWEEYKKTNPSINDDLKPLFEEIYTEYFKSPVEVHTKLGPFMQAMKEGKPVIIDEMNAIPHSVLIMLNDLVTKRTGSTVYPPIPGAEPFQIKEGFCVMATGNYKPEDGLMYIGRQAIDAAFLSRFNLISYDYLPNNRSVEPAGLTKEQSQEWRQNNELMGMLITKMMDKNLSLTAPRNAFIQIEKLSFIARNIQDVFSGTKVGEEWYGSGSSGSKVSPENILKENVLSIRHLIPIIEGWKNEGYSKPLDYYLFTRYISRSGARPAEKAYLYGILQTMGDFFNVEDGWPDMNETDKILGMDETTLNEKLQQYLIPPMLATSGPTEVIEKLFGARPERDPSSIEKEVFIKPPKQGDHIYGKIEAERLWADIESSYKRITGQDTDSTKI